MRTGKNYPSLEANIKYSNYSADSNDWPFSKWIATDNLKVDSVCYCKKYISAQYQNET